MASLGIFVSYASEDRAIAMAVANLLHHTFGASVQVFIDSNGISVGGNIKAEIMAAIKRMDCMIVVSTGVGRRSHEWTGWELGAFDASHQPSGEIRGRVITLCLKSTAPSVVSAMRYVPLDMDSEFISLTPDEFEQKVEIRDDDPLLLLLGQILFETQGQLLKDRCDLSDSFKDKIKGLKREVVASLKCMVRSVLKPQFQLLVKYDSTKANSNRSELPEDAKVTEIGSTFGIFGIQRGRTEHFTRQTESPLLFPGEIASTSMSWSEFKDAVKYHPLSAIWCASLAKVVLSGAKRSLNADNSQVISSAEVDLPRRYRIILTTNTTFFNQEVEASLYLVETLQRQDFGDPATTQLLKGLQIVCRFRFLFLENESTFSYFNVQEGVRPVQLPSVAVRLIAELDNLQNDSLQAELNRPGAWRDFISTQDLEAMLHHWRPIESELRRLCNESIRLEGNDAEQGKLLVTLVEVLKQIEQKERHYNGLLVRGMAASLIRSVGNEPQATEPSPRVP